MKKLYTFKNGPVFLAHPVLIKLVIHSWHQNSTKIMRYRWAVGNTKVYEMTDDFHIVTKHFKLS